MDQPFGSDPDDRLISGLFRFDLLNRLPRTGYLMRGVESPETVGGHTFSTAVLACLLLPGLRADGLRLDGEKLLAMILLHETGETLLGDIPSPAAAFFGPEGKSRAELEAGRKVLREHPENLALLEEYEKAESLEARAAKALDKLQMMIKVLKYEYEGKRGLDEFWSFAKHWPGCGIQRIDALFERVKSLQGKNLYTIFD